MILADTSVWIDHFRSPSDLLFSLLESDLILRHGFVIGELALGSFKARKTVMDTFAGLQEALEADDSEVLEFIERYRLYGSGIGYVDAHLLVATRLTADALLWTRDKRLQAVADRLSLSAKLAH